MNLKKKQSYENFTCANMQADLHSYMQMFMTRLTLNIYANIELLVYMKH